MADTFNVLDSNLNSERIERLVRDGKVFQSSSGKTALTAAGNFRGTFKNPSTSGKRYYLYKVISFASAGPGYANFYINPTAGLPSGAKTINNMFIGHANTSVAELNVDTNLTTALSGGTDTGLVLVTPSAARVVSDFPPMVIPPGVMVGVNNAFTGAADVVMTLQWWEETI